MDTSKILIGGLIGGIVAFLLGYLCYGLLLAEFFESNAGSATGVMRADSDVQWIPLVLGHLTMGLLVAYIFGRWAGISTLTTGAKAGAIIGFLVGCTNSLIGLGVTNIGSMNTAIADIAVSTLMLAVVGGVIGWFYGREKA